MAKCRFWNGREGSCRNGNQCRFEHIDNNNNRNVASTNPFAPLQRGGSITTSNRDHQGQTNKTYPYHLDKNVIIADLSTESPQWSLSAYGPGRDAPQQLFGGPLREQSFEEIRVKHYLGIRSGAPQQAILEYDQLVQASNEQRRTALNDVDGAINFIINSEKDHPNRIDIIQEASRGTQHIPNTFHNNTGSGPFQNSTQLNNSFGASNQVSTGAFSNTATSTNSLSSFGAPTLGTVAPGAAATFGQAALPGTNRASPWGSMTNSSAPAAFGSPSGVSSGFATQSPFQSANTSSFNNAQNPFAPKALPSSSAFGNAQTTANPFGASAAPVNAFANNIATPQNPFSTQSGRQPSSNSYVTPGANGTLSTFKGKRVVYKDGIPGIEQIPGHWQKIWFPDGAPPSYKDTEDEDGAYNDHIKDAYLHLHQTGSFPGNVMPLVPPKREWTSWDF